MSTVVVGETVLCQLLLAHSFSLVHNDFTYKVHTRYDRRTSVTTYSGIHYCSCCIQAKCSEPKLVEKLQKVLYQVLLLYHLFD